MINNQIQFEASLQYLEWLKSSLEGMRLAHESTTPTFFNIISQAYLINIQETQSEICDYLLAHKSSDFLPAYQQAQAQDSY